MDREGFFKAAVEATRDVGLAGMSVKALKARAHCSDGLLYRYFPSLDDLLTDTYVHCVEKVMNSYDKDWFEWISKFSDDCRVMTTYLWYSQIKRLINLDAYGYYYVVFGIDQRMLNPKVGETIRNLSASNPYLSKVIRTIREKLEEENIPFVRVTELMDNMTYLTVLRHKSGDYSFDDKHIEDIMRLLYNSMKADFTAADWKDS